jgi:hypothetical protein
MTFSALTFMFLTWTGVTAGAGWCLVRLLRK